MRRILLACLFAGLPLSLSGMLGMAAALTVLELPMKLYPLFAALPVLSGCFAAAFLAGRRRRAHGIGTGALTALLLTAMWYAAAFCLTGHPGLPVLLLSSIPCGICGGICGVNTKLPLPHRHMHRLQAASARAAMLPLLLHRPKQQQDDSSGV